MLLPSVLRDTLLRGESRKVLLSGVFLGSSPLQWNSPSFLRNAFMPHDQSPDHHPHESVVFVHGDSCTRARTPNTGNGLFCHWRYFLHFGCFGVFSLHINRTTCCLNKHFFPNVWCNKSTMNVVIRGHRSNSVRWMYGKIRTLSLCKFRFDNMDLVQNWSLLITPLPQKTNFNS